jgi:hypothetical protein
LFLIPRLAHKIQMKPRLTQNQFKHIGPFAKIVVDKAGRLMADKKRKGKASA